MQRALVASEHSRGVMRNEVLQSRRVQADVEAERAALQQ